MNKQLKHTSKGVVADMRIITVTIVKIHLMHLTHFILQAAVGSMMHNKLPPEPVV